MNTSFIHVEDKDYVEPETVLTVASTDDQDIPWELLEDPDEDQDVADLRDQLARKQRAFIINVIGTSAFVGGAGLGVALGDMGYIVVILMTIGLFCMDRK